MNALSANRDPTHGYRFSQPFDCLFYFGATKLTGQGKKRGVFGANDSTRQRFFDVFLIGIETRLNTKGTYNSHFHITARSLSHSFSMKIIGWGVIVHIHGAFWS